jgi:RecA-family ATPase
MTLPNGVTTMQYGNAVVDRMPPHSIESEEAVLGSVLIDPEALERVQRVLLPSDFFITRNAWVYEACLALRERNEPLDFVTLVKEMGARGTLDEMGGPAEIARLMNTVPTAIHAEGYAKFVKRASVRRGLLAIISDAAQTAYDESGDEVGSLREIVDKLSALQYAAIARLNGSSRMMTAGEVMRTEWAEPVWIVPELLPSGMGFLHGKPKSGKSWLMLQVACAKATGGRVFDKKIEPGPVLYFALEDHPRRLKSRANRQMWPADTAVDFVMFEAFTQEFGDLLEGGADRISYLIETRGYHLVVIDTFSKAIGMHMQSSDSNDAGAITKALAGLQSVAQIKNACVMFIDHQSKATRQENGDAIGDVYGSVAKAGVSDVMWGLYRERGKMGATLNVTGRDIDEATLLLNFDKEFGQWNYDGDGAGLRMTQRREEIITALTTLKKAMLQTIADYVRQPKNHTLERLQDLVSSGLVLRSEVGNNVWFEINENG